MRNEKQLINDEINYCTSVVAEYLITTEVIDKSELEI